MSALAAGVPPWVAPRLRGRLGAQSRALPGAVPPPLLVLLAILSVQVGAAIAAGLFARIGPAGAVALRLGFAAVVLLPLARPAVRTARRSDLLLVLSFGAVMAGMNLSFYEALDRLPLGVAVTVEFTGPLIVALAGSRRVIDVLWALLAAGGIVLLARGGGSVTLTGVGFALLAGACWAGYILLSQRVGRSWSGLSGLSLAMGVGALLTLPVGIVGAGLELVAVPVLLAGLGLALLSSVLPYSFELQALRRLPAPVFAVLMSLEPAVAALVGLGLLAQALALREWLAIGLVVVACVGATRPRRPGAAVAS